MRLRSRSSRSAAIVAAAVLLAAGCDPSPAPSPGPSGTGEVPPPPPIGGVRIAYPADPPTLNPATDPTIAARELLAPLLPVFFEILPDLSYLPSLLEGEPPVTTEGGRQIVRFRIRPGARWSDGEPVGVDDVAFTARVMRLAGVPAFLGSGFDRLRRVVDEGEGRGRLVLRPPLAGWRDLFSGDRFVLPSHVAERPADVLGWDEGPPVSGGPFRLAKRVPGRSLTYQAVARHSPPPALERLEVTIVPSPTTAIELLEAGKVDAVAPMAGLSWERRLGSLEGVSVRRAPLGRPVLLLVSPSSVPAAGDRRRLLGAIDRGRFEEVVVQEDGRPLDALIPGGGPGAWRGVGQGRPGTAGIEEELRLVFAGSERTTVLARYLRAELERAAVDAELVGLDGEVFEPRFLHAGTFDLALWEPALSVPSRAGRWVGPDGVLGATDPGLRDALGAVDRGRAGSGAALERELRRLGLVLPLFEGTRSAAARDRLEGLRPSAAPAGILWNVEQWRLA